MTRNKMSPNDKITQYMKKPFDLAEKYGQGDKYPLLKYASTIRTKTLRDLVQFQLLLLDNNCNFQVTHTIKELSKVSGVGERRIYDYLKVIHLLNNIQEVSFRRIGL